MKIDKSMIDKVLKMDDEQLWRAIQLVASKSGVKDLSNMSRPSDMSKVRSTLSSLNETDLQNALNLMKKGKENG